MSDEYGPWHVGWVKDGETVEHTFDEREIARREFDHALFRDDIDGPWIVAQSSRDFSTSIRQEAAAEKDYPASIDWEPALDTAATLIEWHNRSTDQDTDEPLRTLIAATLIGRALSYNLPAWSVIHQKISAIVPDTDDPTRYLPEHPPVSVADRIATLRDLLADPDARAALLDRARRVAESNRNDNTTAINPGGDVALSDRLERLRGDRH